MVEFVSCVQHLVNVWTVNRVMEDSTSKKTINFQSEDIDLRLGLRIRTLRQNARLTLDALARETGLSKALLSKIENGKVSSPISTHIKICRALGIPLSELLKEDEEIRFLIVRKDEVKPAPSRKAPHGYRFESLGARWPNKSWNPFILTYEPVPGPHKSPGFQYDGEEFVYVLKGRLEFFYGENRYELDPGDCLFVDGNLPHGGRALGNEKCIVLMVVVPRNR